MIFISTGRLDAEDLKLKVKQSQNSREFHKIEMRDFQKMKTR